MDEFKINTLFNGIYAGKRILVTGNTGFKGSWLHLWLSKLGANVYGVSNGIPTLPSHFECIFDNSNYTQIDIRDQKKVFEYFKNNNFDIVFHLAAQPLVRYSYDAPLETYETNINGTLNILEAIRTYNSSKAIVVITSDKCYENKEWDWSYRENDPLGGYDPYSNSKACVELITSAYQNSYFNTKHYLDKHSILLASARAGNVIGGGDWALDRIIPDSVKAASNKEKLIIRNPHAIRPWQHVLEPLSGYLLLGQKLLEQQTKFARAWNFGPQADSTISVESIIKIAQQYWKSVEYEVVSESVLHEANLLKLDCTLAFNKLQWKPVWDINKTIEKTVNWYKEYYETGSTNSEKDLFEYIRAAKEKHVLWSK